VEVDARLRRENEVADRQACRFLDPGTGVVQEQQESAVAQRGVPCCRQACDQCLNLIALQELGRRWRRPFPRNCRDALRFGERLRYLAGQEAEEGVQAGEALIARTDVIAGLLVDRVLPQ
jgi:hypothetical protein